MGEEAVLLGLDGRKMSKSYGNTIPLFEPEKKLQKSINKIVTNLKEPGEPKNTEDSTLFEIYKAFATPSEVQEMAQAYADGIAWGEAKKIVFQKINSILSPMREKYMALTANPAQIEEILQFGAEKARKIASERLKHIREAVGIRTLK